MTFFSTLHFATPGLPLQTPKRDTKGGISYSREIGIDAMELEFVRSIYLKEEQARDLGSYVKEQNFHLTIHGPYSLNLNAKEESLRLSSIERIIHCARIGSLCGACSITFHPAYYLKDDPREVYRRVKMALEKILAITSALYPGIMISPETTGKPTQFGSLEELLQLASEIDGLSLCVDFAHLHARTNGKYNTKGEFRAIFDCIATKLGQEKLQHMHMHYSGLSYGEKGEKKHLPLLESDANFSDLLLVLKEYDVKGILVVESPLVEKDVLFLKQEYEKLS